MEILKTRSLSALAGGVLSLLDLVFGLPNQQQTEHTVKSGMTSTDLYTSGCRMNEQGGQTTPVIAFTFFEGRKDL